MNNSKIKGSNAESMACKWLESNGFSIIKCNFFAKFGEIDIIALKNKILYFIEVKSSFKNNEPIYAITPKKLEKIYKSIDVFFNSLDSSELENKENLAKLNFCVCAILVKNKQIEFLENISL